MRKSEESKTIMEEGECWKRKRRERLIDGSKDGWMSRGKDKNVGGDPPAKQNANVFRVVHIFNWSSPRP